MSAIITQELLDWARTQRPCAAEVTEAKAMLGQPVSSASRFFRQWLAFRTPDTEIQVALARDEMPYVRECLADNRSLTPEAQTILRNDENQRVRDTLNSNPTHRSA